MRLGTAEVLIKATKKGFDASVKASKKVVQDFGKSSVASIGRVTASFASLAGVAGIGGMSVALVKSGANFEKQMATVRGVMRANEDQFAKLEAAAKLAGETTEWSATQSAEALNYMAMAGYSVNDAVSALPDVLNLATAGGLALGRASDIVTDSLTAMGLGVKDLAEFNDILTGTITRSNTNIEMLGESMKYVAPIASKLGYNTRQLSAMLGTLANSGIKASDAGTDLRQGMIRNIKAAKALGTAEDDLIGTLRAAKEAGWGVNEVTKNYGMIASKSILVLMDSISGYEKLYATLQNVRGETANLAKIKLDTLDGDFKILKSTIEGVGLAAYASLKGDLREGVQDLTGFIRAHKQDIIDFANSANELSKSLGTMGAHAATLFSTTVSGWNSLPTVVQELGIVGAMIGGVKAKAALLLITTAIGQVKKFDATMKGVKTVDKLAGHLVLAQNRLASLKESMAGLRGDDVRVFGPRYQRDIDELEARIVNLQATIEAESISELEIATATAAKKIEIERQAALQIARIKSTVSSGGASLSYSYIGDDPDAMVAARDQWMKYVEDMNKAMPDSYDSFGPMVSAAEEAGTEISASLSAAFYQAENALVSFVTGGKVSFASLTDSIIKDLARIQIQKLMTKSSNWLAGLFHEGGVAGRGGQLISVNPFAFANAPRLHSGGGFGLANDEIPAIIQTGERVLTRDQTRAYDAGASAGRAPNNNYLSINATTNVNAIDSRSGAQFIKSQKGEIAKGLYDLLKKDGNFRGGLKGVLN